MEMAEKKGFGDGQNPQADLAKYQQALQAVKGDPLYQKLFDDKVKEKHIRFIIEDDISKGVNHATAYKNHLEKLTPEQMANQKGLHENIGKNVDLQNYINTNVVPDIEYHKEFFKRLSREQRAAYIDKKLSPGQATRSQEQPKRKMENVEKERAEKAQAEINKQFPPENQA